MFVYSHTITPRLQYTIHFLSHYFGKQIALTSDATDFAAATGIKINYTNGRSDTQSLWLPPTGLLFDNGIEVIDPQCFDHANGYKAIFGNTGILGFDIFSAVFYLLSRYEEYLPHSLDCYGRFAHQNSLAYKEGFLHQPLVNIWLEDLRRVILDSFGQQLPAARFSFVPTYDIDIAWSYKNKGLLRNAGGFGKSFLKRDWWGIKSRALAITGIGADPYDAFAWMEEIHEKYTLEPIYFFHVGQKRNKYDKNISTNNERFRQLVKSTAEKYKVGLHPSWHSGDAHDYLHIEKAVLEKITGKTIWASRQHYIRFDLPLTFRRLIGAGTLEDYSMGYGSINGFRASVATPFYWYDLERERQTELLLHPFCFMDANSFFELGHTPQQGFEELLQMYSSVKAVNGTLYTLWHNTFLGTDIHYKGWREMYERALKKMVG